MNASVPLIEVADRVPDAPWAWKYPHDPEQWDDQIWRLHNLYYVVDKYGYRVKFRPNWAQIDLLEKMWFTNVILKARQLGFTTFIDLLLLDNCIWQPDKRAGIICHALPDAAVIFRDKVKFPFDNLPDEIKERAAPKLDSANELLFANNSSIRVGTSMRSGTFNYLHISEYGKLCARTPDKAREVRTGALNTVQAGQLVFIESTAEGRAGHFFELCQTSEKLARSGKTLTALDYKFHFYPWWQHPDYVLEAADGEYFISAELAEYFHELEVKEGIVLSEARRFWYFKKSIEQGEDMRREYPSTSAEAFQASVEGAYYRKDMLKARSERRIKTVPYIRDIPVNTFWDLGFNDFNAIWFHQQVGTEHRFIDYLQDSGEADVFYAKKLQERPYVYGTHYLPHDADQHWKDGNTAYDRYRKLLRGMGRVQTVTKVAENRLGVSAVRAILPQCWFDEQKCEVGIGALDLFRKEWDEKNGCWKETYKHDDASHGAKAFEGFARTFEAIPGAAQTLPGARTRGWRSRKNRGRRSYMTV
jgi:hypothetical protein